MKPGRIGGGIAAGFLVKPPPKPDPGQVDHDRKRPGCRLQIS